MLSNPLNKDTKTMTNQLIFGILISLLIICSCKNNQKETPKEINPFEAAMPHGSTLPDSELSEEDKYKLANAKGKSALPITANELDSLLQSSSDILHIYSFFKVDNLDCKIINDALIDIQKEVGDTLIKLVFFSIDKAQELEKINVSIRESSVTSDVFYSSDILNWDWFSKINSNWSGEIPALYLINQSDGTNLFYQKKFTKEELSVLIQPLIL